MREKLQTTVVMATYNGEKNIIEQLNSLKNQSQKIDEVIIKDDCHQYTICHYKKHVYPYALRHRKTHQNSCKHYQYRTDQCTFIFFNHFLHNPIPPLSL